MLTCLSNRLMCSDFSTGFFNFLILFTFFLFWYCLILFKLFAILHTYTFFDTFLVPDTPTVGSNLWSKDSIVESFWLAVTARVGGAGALDWRQLLRPWNTWTGSFFATKKKSLVNIYLFWELLFLNKSDRGGYYASNVFHHSPFCRLKANQYLVPRNRTHFVFTMIIFEKRCLRLVGGRKKIIPTRDDRFSLSIIDYWRLRHHELVVVVVRKMFRHFHASWNFDTNYCDAEPWLIIGRRFDTILVCLARISPFPSIV